MAEQTIHGSISGWQFHQDHGTNPCQACKRAKNAYNRAYRQHGKCAPGLGWPLLPGNPAPRRPYARGNPERGPR